MCYFYIKLYKVCKKYNISCFSLIEKSNSMIYIRVLYLVMYETDNNFLDCYEYTNFYS